MVIDTVENIEIGIVVGIVITQLWFFSRTLKEIFLFKTLIPDSDSLQLVNQNQDDPPVNTIHCNVTTNSVFERILTSLNTYLVRNRSAATDFHLIKDIVERNTDAVQDDINLTIAVPLYLGLMGTMIGVVVSLFSMAGISETITAKAASDQSGEVVSILLAGVKIAMIASFTGLLLTIINSGFIFKGSKKINELRKNAFYTFIQVELLPVINQGIGATFLSLQTNLHKFNETFGSNLNRLSGIFDRNYNVLELQQEILDSLERTNIVEMAKYNVSVLQELRESVGQFTVFNQYLSNVNQYVESSYRLTGKITDLLERTDSVKDITKNIDAGIKDNNSLVKFLSEHFADLQRQREFISVTVADTGHAVSDLFKELHQHIQRSGESVKTFTIDELELLRQTLTQSRTNLGNLQYLESMDKAVTAFQLRSGSQGEEFHRQLDELQLTLKKSEGLLDQIGREMRRPSGISAFVLRLAHLFKRQKNEE